MPKLKSRDNETGLKSMLNKTHLKLKTLKFKTLKLKRKRIKKELTCNAYYKKAGWLYQ